MNGEMVKGPETITTVRTPAKLNLRLKVMGVRPDGYHELVSIMVPVNVTDTLLFAPSTRGITLSCDGISVPENEDNLVFRAAKTFFDRTHFRPALSISLTKQIPVAAGLGGGSSDAAATLKTLNHMYGHPLKWKEMSDTALALGADVPFFLYNRPSIARGIGERLEPIPNWPVFSYLIVSPSFRVPTAWVYDNLKLELTIHEDDPIVRLLKKGPPEIHSLLENDLETVTAVRYPVVNSIKKLLVEAGAEGALMTGSGPTVFGVFRSEGGIRKARELVISYGFGSVYLAGPYEEAGPHART